MTTAIFHIVMHEVIMDRYHWLYTRIEPHPVNMPEPIRYRNDTGQTCRHRFGTDSFWHVYRAYMRHSISTRVNNEHDFIIS